MQTHNDPEEGLHKKNCRLKTRQKFQFPLIAFLISQAQPGYYSLLQRPHHLKMLCVKNEALGRMGPTSPTPPSFSKCSSWTRTSSKKYWIPGSTSDLLHQYMHFKKTLGDSCAQDAQGYLSAGGLLAASLLLERSFKQWPSVSFSMSG